MKGRITKNGFLEIKRGSLLTMQHCPFDKHIESNGCGVAHDDCGDWCPLFGEPIIGSHPTTNGHGMPGKGIRFIKISLCHKILEFDNLLDERI